MSCTCIGQLDRMHTCHRFNIDSLGNSLGFPLPRFHASPGRAQMCVSRSDLTVRVPYTYHYIPSCCSQSRADLSTLSTLSCLLSLAKTRLNPFTGPESPQSRNRRFTRLRHLFRRPVLSSRPYFQRFISSNRLRSASAVLVSPDLRIACGNNHATMAEQDNNDPMWKELETTISRS